MNITKKELEILEACRNESDWGKACDAIKKARKGMYPDDWWDKVKLSGMMDRVMNRWGGSSNLTVTEW